MKNETLGIGEIEELQVPEFKSYEEEVSFWDNLDTADFMEDDGEWFSFETPRKWAIRIAILPKIAEEFMQSAHAQGVSVETLVNVLLRGCVRKSAETNKASERGIASPKMKR